MNNYYLYDYVNSLERVLSAGYLSTYSTSALERNISYSSCFQKIEDDKHSSPVINDSQLVKSIMPEINVDLFKIPVLKQCLWASESYIRIQEKTGLTFECIFLYIPIRKMYDYFALYHEMDFSQIVDEFQRLYLSHSPLEILIKKSNYSLEDVSRLLAIPYETLVSFKKRKRDIKKASVGIVQKLSKLFNVRIETIAEIKL